MGIEFSMEDANAIAWLTAPPQTWEGGLPLQEAHQFFCRLAKASGGASGTGLISRNRQWIEDIYAAARQYYFANPDGQRQEETRKTLAVFGRHLGFARLYGVGATNSADSYPELDAFLRECAFSSGDHGLFMIPRRETVGRSLDLLAPFPAFKLLGTQLADWPGVLFWTPTGTAAFAPLALARDLYSEIRHVLGNQTAVDAALANHEKRRTHAPMVIQLRNLHFGTERAAETQAYLMTTVQRIARMNKVARIVITGDLFDNPKRHDALTFGFFRQQLQSITGQDPIVIPGNHDQKHWGNFRWSIKDLADLEWSSLVVDEDLTMCFLCFDSSRDANLARGRVTASQRMEVATKYDAYVTSHPSVAHYLPVALLHHHPFTFRVHAKGVWKMLSRFNIDEEDFLQMTDGDEFVSWCAARGITLALHGHKHVPHHVDAQVPVSSGKSHAYTTVRAVGCGSSTGLGGPLSINCMCWHPQSQQWAATFLIDPGDGRGFSEEEITIRPVKV
jgi:Calcineurin-like phosphoesterase